MSAPIDIAGQRFGRLMALRPVRPEGEKRRWWFCRCDCGTEKPIRTNDLRAGIVASCGCLKRDTRPASFKDGRSNHPLNATWSGMLDRCQNPDNASYHLYGARGIEVCAAWLDFWKFVEDMHPRSAGLSLDRKDTNGPYSKDNCRWATAKQQQHNRRDNLRGHFLGHDGTPLATACDQARVPRSRYYQRLRHGWSMDAIMRELETLVPAR